MQNTILKVLAGIGYFLMVGVNFLANSLPINNRTTGEISDAYPNLFAPAGVTFSIWGLIYLLLGGYVFYQFTKGAQTKEALIGKVNIFFIITSLANIAWIFAWHYDFIGISVLIMLVLLGALIKIANIFRGEKLETKEKIFLSIPFNIYFGWITVATIANITVFLVSISWDGFGVADFTWTMIILLVGVMIGIARMNKDRNIAYGLVLIWAYAGILLKHLSADGFDGRYPSVIATLIGCLVLLVLFSGKIFVESSTLQKIKK